MDVSEAVENCRWTLTTYITPHEYIRLADYPEAFMILAEAIDKDGIPEMFRGRVYRYLFHEDYKYWRMGVVLNRIRIKSAAAA